MTIDPETRASLLVQLTGADNQKAWFEFVDLYQPVILNFAKRQGLQHADAQDVVQTVLTRVARKAHSWDPNTQRGSFRGWLAVTVRNLAIDLFRSRKNQPEGLPVGQEWVAPESNFDWEQRRSLFQWAAGVARSSFQTPTWEAFWQTAVLHRPVAEVAKELQMSSGAIYVARSRVLARLRELVSQSEFDSREFVLPPQAPNGSEAAS